MAITSMPRAFVPISDKHTVVPGQTLADVARVHRITVNQLIQANPGKAPGGVLAPGTRLTIPTSRHPQRLG
jgi:LysM repeat protein